jgi:hypothetical protein
MNAMKELLTSLQNVCPYFIGGLPTLIVSPFGPRGEGEGRDKFTKDLFEEAERYGFKSQILRDGNVFSLITPAASPHTTEMIKINLNSQEVEIPAHLIIWWGEVARRVDFLSLSRMKEEERKKLIDLISSNIHAAWRVLYDSLPEERYKNNVSKFLEIYGLVGHATEEERKNSGLSRGAQSNQEGHINICFHPYDKYRKQAEKKGINAADFLKHTGVMDTILMNKFGDFFSQITGLIFNIPNLSVSWELKHASSENQISIYEGLRLNFYEKPLQLNKALEFIAKIVGFYDQIYEDLKQGFENCWKNIGNENKKKEVIRQLKRSLVERLRQIGVINVEMFDRQIDSLIDMTLSFRPTYQQLTNWEKDENIDESLRDIISRLKNKYKKRRERLKTMTNEQRKVFVDRVARFYGVDSIVAESLVLMIENQIADPADDWKNIKFTFPNQISLSWMIEEYEIGDNGEILVTKITIAPRFMTEKGVFEDIAGMKIDRPQGI